MAPKKTQMKTGSSALTKYLAKLAEDKKFVAVRVEGQKEGDDEVLNGYIAEVVDDIVFLRPLEKTGLTLIPISKIVYVIAGR